MTMPPFEAEPPASDTLTEYDERHLVTYLRLLDAASEGADWREAVRIIFEVDPGEDVDFARRLHDSHLARARWMTQAGYRDLLSRKTP